MRAGRRGKEESSETFGGWAAAKSEIDCSAITIRCTQPGDGFSAEAMCFRVGVISVSAFFRIFQTDRTRPFGRGWLLADSTAVPFRSDATSPSPSSLRLATATIIAARTMRMMLYAREWLYKGDDISSLRKYAPIMDLLEKRRLAFAISFEERRREYNRGKGDGA